MMEAPLPSQARVVIIGGGIAGVGTAYHLAQKGWKDIVLVDQGSLFNTGGSSSHAPGGIGLIDQRSELISSFGRVSAELYDKMGTLQRVGSLTLMRTEEDRQATLAEQAFCNKIGLQDVRLLSANEVGELWPQLDTGKIVGALYYPPTMRVAPGRLSAVRTITELAKAASRTGAASFYQHTRVERILVKENKVVGVETSRGVVTTDNVVIAAGIWGPLVSRTAGIELPIAHVQHQWTLTQPIGAFSKYAFPLNTDGPGHQDLPSALPCLWDPKSATYTYQMGPCLGIGNYNHKALVVDADEIASFTHRGASGPAEMSFTPEHFEVARTDMEALLPSLKGVPLRKAFNGLMSYAPDGFPLIGPVNGKNGLWVIECTYVWHAGGASKLLSEWMDAGRPPVGVDVSSVDVNRFKGKVFSKEELRAGAAVTYESRMTDHRKSHVSAPHTAKL